MLTTTTHSLQGHTISQYRGLVMGEAILGANIFKDLLQASATLLAAGPAPMRTNCSGRGQSPLTRCAPRPK